MKTQEPILYTLEPLIIENWDTSNSDLRHWEHPHIQEYADSMVYDDGCSGYVGNLVRVAISTSSKVRKPRSRILHYVVCHLNDTEFNDTEYNLLEAKAGIYSTLRDTLAMLLSEDIWIPRTPDTSWTGDRGERSEVADQFAWTDFGRQLNNPNPGHLYGEELDWFYSLDLAIKKDGEEGPWIWES